jgi:hypothetical protein
MVLEGRIECLEMAERECKGTEVLMDIVLGHVNRKYIPAQWPPRLERWVCPVDGFNPVENGGA